MTKAHLLRSGPLVTLVCPAIFVYLQSMDEMKILLEEVKRLSRLIAALGVDGKSQREKIRLLAAAGFPPIVIAPMIGTTANTVRVVLATIRKQGKSKRKRRKKQ